MCTYKKIKIFFTFAVSSLFSIIILANNIPCYEGIDCSNQDTQALGLFKKLIQNNNTDLTTIAPNASYKASTQAGVIEEDSEETINMEDLIALSLKDQTVYSVVARILPNWQIELDESIQGLKIDIIIQTTRQQAINDIAKAMSTRAKFYKYTKPKPTITLFKI